MTTFGEQLGIYRLLCIDKDTGKGLSQGRLAEKLSVDYGIEYSTAMISYWENNQRKINKDDRLTLTALISIFYEYEALKTIAEANQWLESGDYSPLSREEQQQIFSFSTDGDSVWV